MVAAVSNIANTGNSNEIGASNSTGGSAEIGPVKDEPKKDNPTKNESKKPSGYSMQGIYNPFASLEESSSNDFNDKLCYKYIDNRFFKKYVDVKGRRDNDACNGQSQIEDRIKDFIAKLPPPQVDEKLWKLLWNDEGSIDEDKVRPEDFGLARVRPEDIVAIIRLPTSEATPDAASDAAQPSTKALFQTMSNKRRASLKKITDDVDISDKLTQLQNLKYKTSVKGALIKFKESALYPELSVPKGADNSCWYQLLVNLYYCCIFDLYYCCIFIPILNYCNINLHTLFTLSPKIKAKELYLEGEIVSYNASKPQGDDKEDEPITEIGNKHSLTHE